MGAIGRILLIALVLMLLAGIGVLATWDLPAPVKPVEKVIPDDRFPR